MIKRKANIELLRLIAMMMVVTNHYIGRGHILENVQIKNLFFFVNYGIVNYDRQEGLVTEFGRIFVKILSWGHNHGY